LKRIVQDDESDENVAKYFSTMLASLVSSFPPCCDHKIQSMVNTNLHEIESPLLQLVDTFKFASSVRWSSECVVLAMILRNVAHVVSLSLKMGTNAEQLIKSPSVIAFSHLLLHLY
jgi:hypothetical protein